MENLFKKVPIGGYSTKEVYKYLHELNVTFEARMQQKNEEIRNLKSQLEDMSEEPKPQPKVLKQEDVLLDLESKIKDKRSELKILQAELAGLKNIASELMVKLIDGLRDVD